ncbi:hypothetical protein NKG94_07005 [Micromonospora sp. M12]
MADPQLRDRIHHLHQTLAVPGDEFEAESRLALILDRLRRQLGQHARPALDRPDAGSRSACGSCWTPGPSTASRWPRPPSCCTPTRPTWSGRSVRCTACRHTRT